MTQSSHGWCSLRLRFDERELVLLRGSEHLRGLALAREAKPQDLRSALNLARAGQKLGRVAAGNPVVLEEPEVGLLVEALSFARTELQWAMRAGSAEDGQRRGAVVASFPELGEKDAWRSFGIAREMEALSGRLQTALAN
jgi:hypothetical protein